MKTMIAKLSLLFVGGLALGLAVPREFGPAKPAGNSQDVGPPGDRTMTVRCIVEYPAEGAGFNRFGGRLVPGPDDDIPDAAPVHRPVQVRVQPNPAKAANGSDHVTLVFRLNSCCGCGELANQRLPGRCPTRSDKRFPIASLAIRPVSSVPPVPHPG